MKNGFILALGFSMAIRAAADTPLHFEAKSVSAEQIAAEMAAAKQYEFDVAADGGLIDAQGAKIAPGEIADYLKKNALDAKGYAVLWITADSPPLDALGITVRPFGNYGFTKIVVRPRPGVTPKTTAQKKPPVFIQGKRDPASFVAGMPFPPMHRPPSLQPEPLPPRVRYKFAADEEVTAAAQMLSDHLLNPSDGGPAPLWNQSIWVLPGAWKSLSPATGLTEPAVQKVQTALRTRSGILRLQGTRIVSPPAKAALEVALRQMIQAAGGGQIRALKTTEMAAWWPFIALDITEPTLVLETADGQHRFVLVFEKRQIVSIDDLAGLPAL